MFSYLFWEGGGEHERGKDTERGRDWIPSIFHTVSTKPNTGLELVNSEIMTRAEIESEASPTEPWGAKESGLTQVGGS